MKDILAITKALSDENRLRALMLLRKRELCLCQIVELLGLASSTVSRHMAILSQAELVECTKYGRWRHYRRSKSRAPHIHRTFRWLDEILCHDPIIAQDAARAEPLPLTPWDDEACPPKAKSKK